MPYKSIEIQTGSNPNTQASLLLIYTGGTLGMAYNKSNNHLVPFDFEQIIERIPELGHFGYQLTIFSIEKLVDSANITPDHWIMLSRLIEENYDKYDGFVIVHGTDTMAYSASALSFLFEDLNKPVIFTGAQLPIGVARTDARENLITALEIAAARKNGCPIVTEVCIYFNNKLLRGNRARKMESAQFGAFESANYPPLAECGIKIYYNFMVIKPCQPFSRLKVYNKMDTNIALLKIFPGIRDELVETITTLPGLRGLVIETYGAGNAPTRPGLIKALKKAIDSGVLIYNVSQCAGGTVMQGRYETSRQLAEIGVISGGDITTEAATAKMMFLLGNYTNPAQIRRELSGAIRGEMS